MVIEVSSDRLRSQLAAHVDHLLATGKALIDVPHWAAEWLWLPVAASALREDVGADNVATSVSNIDTSPWTVHIGRKS
jgi:hypothetical protein